MVPSGLAWRARWLAALAAAIFVAGCNDDDSAVDSSAESATFSAEGWMLETVDSTSGAGVYNSLAFDPSGNPAISYLSGNLLNLARRQTSGWTIQTVDSLASSNAPGSGPFEGGSVAFSPAGVPMVAYRKKADLYFAQWTGSAWSVVLIDKNTSRASLVIDPTGAPSMAYVSGVSTGKKGTPAGLKLARRSGSAWTSEVVDSQGGSFASLAYDLTGNPAIAYEPSSGDAVKVARKFGSVWTLEVVESGGTNWGRYASLAFNPATGYPAIYHGSVTFNMPAQPAKRFVQWNGSAWVAEAVVSTTGGLTSAYGGELAFEPDGTPIVSYQYVTNTASNQTIRFARRVADVWETTDISQSASLGPSDISLAFNGAPSLAFRANGVLCYARFVGP